jgi:hypothetical protein
MSAWRSLWLPAGCALLLAGSPASHGTEIRDFVVSHDRANYSVDMQFVTRASASQLLTVLTDYPRLVRLDASLVSTEVLPGAAPGATRVRTRAKGCVLFLCVDIVRVEDVTRTVDGALEARMVPGMGDFKSGFTRCTLEDGRAGTQAHYTSTLEPDFFIPPLIGPVLVERGLRQGLARTVNNLDRLALHEPR